MADLDKPLRLLGRQNERAEIERVLSSARGGRSAVLVIRGEAGVGKSVLLRHAAERAGDFRVAQVAGVESEMELPFAGLHQLCAPVLSELDALPAPQALALRVALGLEAGDPPDRFFVALGALTLLAAVAEERPLLCLIDDAQWLDDASLQLLGFVARRLLAESIAMVFVLRTPSGDGRLADLPELALRGLDEEDARALLAESFPGRIDERVRDRIVGETRGNPLALRELPRGLSAAELAGGFRVPELQHLTGWIEESFARRLEELPPQTRQLLLIAAAEPTGDPALMWKAAGALGISTAALEPAVRGELLHVGTQVRFPHPLVRSAVYGRASDTERRQVHAAIAAATDPELEPDRRAWHRAQATTEPDEDVAAELERSAGRAQTRGGLAAAAAFLACAAELTTDSPRRADRMLAAAEAMMHAGAFDDALGVLAAVQAEPLSELARARVDLLRAAIAFAQHRGRDAPPLLLRAARTLETLDAGLARDTYLDAWSAGLFAGSLATAGGMEEVSRAVSTAPAPPNGPRPADRLLDGFALVFNEGREAATPILQRATAEFAGTEVSVEEVLRWGWLATAGAVYVWDHDTCLEVATREVELARASGALEVLAVAVNVCGQAAALAGEFARAARLIAEADAVTRATGMGVGPYAALVLAGFRGEDVRASELIATTIKQGTASGQGTVVQYAHWAHALLLNGMGRYADAQRAATTASNDTPELFVAGWALCELVEAAMRNQDASAARDAVARLDESTSHTDAPWALGARARAHALLDYGEGADALYQEAIAHFGRTQLRPELARSELLYGEWLRRAQRRSDARTRLRSAHAAFAVMGAGPFADRAARELRACGENVRKRSVENLGELTTHEAEIAHMAADGHTNTEIGAQLFLSPRTVEWHLSNVFAKLGVKSRRELRSALPGARPLAA